MICPSLEIGWGIEKTMRKNQKRKQFNKNLKKERNMKNIEQNIDLFEVLPRGEINCTIKVSCCEPDNEVIKDFENLFNKINLALYDSGDFPTLLKVTVVGIEDDEECYLGVMANEDERFEFMQFLFIETMCLIFNIQ